MTSNNTPIPPMALRDYFAGCVMTGMLAADPDYPANWEIAATAAYAAADAMLTARRNPEPRHHG